MAVSKMRFGVSCASFEGPPRQSKARFQCYLEYFPGSIDFTGMNDTSFQRGFWEAPESLLGIICDAYFWRPPSSPFGVIWEPFCGVQWRSWGSLGALQASPGALLVGPWSVLECLGYRL